MQRNIENIEDLRFELIEGFKMVRDDPRRALQAKEMANLGGKIINSVKLEIEYASIRKEKPEISFLEKVKKSKSK